MSNQVKGFAGLLCNARVCSLLVLTIGLPTAHGATTAEKKSAGVPKARAESPESVANHTIFWGVDKNGAVTLTDRPNQLLTKESGQRAAQGLAQNPSIGSGQSGSATFAPANDAVALARAQREREYWREQADKFQARQRDRERDLEETRRMRLLDAQVRDPVYYSSRIYARSADYIAQRNAPYVPGFRTQAVYTSSPGAASAGGPAAFIGSGFSTSGRR